MANPEHLAVLRQGVAAWNRWREEHQDIPGEHFDNIPDLSGFDFRGYDLSDADLSWVDLRETNLSNVKLLRADLTEAILYKADLRGADLLGALCLRSDLREACLQKASLCLASLAQADLAGADLTAADLSDSDLIEADFTGANLTCANLTRTVCTKTSFDFAFLVDCTVYGISVWDTYLDGAIQLNLAITSDNQPQITVDNLEVAQFIYLLLNNQKIRHVINTVTSKVVLILGRFTPERKQVLDALRDELRNHNLLPVVFDFDNAPNRNLTETVKTLGGMSRFIIADITDSKSIPQELYAIVPHAPSIPVQPLIHVSEQPYGMYESIAIYPWVLPLYRYQDIPGLLTSLKEKIIEPAERKAKELEERKRGI